jgi:hypothetical protein
MGTFAQLNGFGCERPIDRIAGARLHGGGAGTAAKLGQLLVGQVDAIQRVSLRSGTRVNLCQLLLRPA